MRDHMAEFSVFLHAVEILALHDGRNGNQSKFDLQGLLSAGALGK
jgi:hypothetical protein